MTQDPSPETAQWTNCLRVLDGELTEANYNTYIRPLEAVSGDDGLRLLAPNHFVVDWVDRNCLETIRRYYNGVNVTLGVGSRELLAPQPAAEVEPGSPRSTFNSRLNPDFTFKTFVKGKSNQLAAAAAQRVGRNPGLDYNPLFIYGGVGLGKTHLMHAIGNQIQKRKPGARVAYLHSERFVSEMVRGLQFNAIADFKRTYRSLDALLIDDIQFFAGKDHSQEEFFHTYNALLEDQRQIVLTGDRFPKDVDRLDERLKSRFGSGLNVRIEPPELEHCVAILMSKAAAVGVSLPEEVAFFMAQRIRSNVRELEGALKSVIATAELEGQKITLDLTKEALRDLLALHDRRITIDSIQKTVAAYYKIRVSDLLSKRKTRSVARPRQVAMALAKELTRFSLPEIGDRFGGRDHTTALHACRRIRGLRETDSRIEEDYNNLFRTLTN